MVINLEKVDELIEKLTGEETVKLVRLIIEGKENVSEFILAEKLEIKINTVRNMLYGLQKYNLVTSMRKKDKQKGWYIYYWTFNEVQAKVLMKTVKQEEIELLKKRLEKEEDGEYYNCPKKCLRLNFVNAMDNDFKCPLCEKVLKQADNKKIIKELKKEIEILEAVQDPIQEQTPAVEA